MEQKTTATKANSAGLGGAIGAVSATIINDQFGLNLGVTEMTGLTALMTAVFAWVFAWLPSNKVKAT